MKRNRKPYFKKPNDICVDLSDEQGEILSMNRFSFNRWLYDDLQRRQEEYNVVLRRGTLTDIPLLQEFTETYYTALEGNSLTSYDYYRFTEYGNSLILEKDEKVVGVIFEVGYDTPERTSYAMRFVVEPGSRGKGYAQILTDASCLKALERGSSLIRATIAVKNHVSLFFHLNKVGMVIESINPVIKGLTRYYQASLPVSPYGIYENRIDRAKLKIFLSAHKEGEDYWLYDSDDIESIEEALIDKRLKLVSYIPVGGKRFQFLALSSQQINFFYDNY